MVLFSVIPVCWGDVGLLGSLEDDDVLLNLMIFGAVGDDPVSVLDCGVIAAALEWLVGVLDAPSLMTFLSKLTQDGGGLRRSPDGRPSKEVRRREDSGVALFL